MQNCQRAKVVAGGVGAEVGAQGGDAGVSAEPKPVANDVVGADQVLVLEGRILSKPDSMEAARWQLLDLRGKSHTLYTAVAVATKGETIWSETEIATLTMRKLSPEFIGRYLPAARPR